MAEQSHKREMTEAVRGDFERLRARQEGGPQGPKAMSQAPARSAPEARIVLTRPPGPREVATDDSPISAPEPSRPERRRFAFLRRR